MKDQLLATGYAFDPTTRIWARNGYGGIAYTDGDEVELRIARIVDQVADLSVLSQELRNHCTDWASLYHLTGTRANLLRPFGAQLQGADVLEIGAGCGAITRYLGESGAHVLALEGTPRRAAIARARTRELANVEVVADSFEQFSSAQRFDVVTLIGVLEYANRFVAGASPATVMLQRARALLKPNGRLIVAIENQLGLKYFAGAAEDHVGVAMYGVEDRYRSDEVRTYGRQALERLLHDAGFVQTRWMAPFPDYKLPVSIVTQEGFQSRDFDAAAFAWQSVMRDPQLPGLLAFSPEQVWPVLARNGLAMDLANSFLVVAEPIASPPEAEPALAYHYSTGRAKRYCKQTRFVRRLDATMAVECQALGPADGSEDGRLQQHVAPVADFVPGTPLSLTLLRIVSADGWSVAQVGAFLQEYLRIAGQLEALTDIEAQSWPADRLLPGSFFDLIPQNIIVRADGGGYAVIDREWVWRDGISVGWLLFRALLSLLNSTTRFGHPADVFERNRMGFVQAGLRAAGLEMGADDIAAIARQDALVQRLAAGIAETEPMDWAPLAPLPFENLSRGLAARDAALHAQTARSDQLVQELAAQQATAAQLDETLRAVRAELAVSQSQVAQADAAKQAAQLEAAELRELLLQKDMDQQAMRITGADAQHQLHAMREELGRVRHTLAMAAHELQLIQSSTLWRAFLTVRDRLLAVPAPVRRQLRRVAKAAWWLMTPQLLPARIAFLRERAGRQAAITAAQPATTSRAAKGPAALTCTPRRDALGRAVGAEGDSVYRLHCGPGDYVYVAPRRPDDLAQRVDALDPATRFSIVVPLYNTPDYLFERMVASVQAQWYPHWELILVDDKSPSVSVRENLTRLQDSRIRVILLEKNEGISGATNHGLRVATGDFVVFLDHDDELTEDCLFELAQCIDREDPDYIYSDEDKIEADGRFGQPFFKPDWSPDALMSTMYTCHVSCVRRSLLEKTGLLRPEFDGTQDWDFVLRVAEQARTIAHVPKVLYHWRVIPQSVAADLNAKPYAVDAGRRARIEAMQRRGQPGVMEPVPQLPGYFRAVYDVQGTPLVSIIIPTRDNGAVLRRCIDTICGQSTYSHREVVVMDNGSVEPATVEYLASLARDGIARVVRHDHPFNYSELNNLGAREARGDILLFLNDDTEVLMPDWLERMIGFAQLPHVGAVGAKLLYPGGERIQHAGVLNLANGPGHAMLGRGADEPGYFGRGLLEYNWLVVTGACLMVSRSKFEDVGGFGEEFPIAYNDVELCFKLHKHGYLGVVCQQVRLIHHESISRGQDHMSKEKAERLTQDRLRLYQKHPDMLAYDPFYNPNLTSYRVDFQLLGDL